MKKVYDKVGDLDLAITGWTELVHSHPSVRCLRDQLQKLYEQKDDLNATILGWKTLSDAHPESPELKEALKSAENRLGYKRTEELKSYASRLDAQRDYLSSMNLWKELLDEAPYDNEFRTRLCAACKNLDIGQAAWSELVINHPQKYDFAHELEAWFKISGECGEEIKFWKSMMENNFTLSSYFYTTKLSNAFAGTDHVEEIQYWKGLLEKKQKEILYWQHLSSAYGRHGLSKLSELREIGLRRANYDDLIVSKYSCIYRAMEDKFIIIIC